LFVDWLMVFGCFYRALCLVLFSNKYIFFNLLNTGC